MVWQMLTLLQVTNQVRDPERLNANISKCHLESERINRAAIADGGGVDDSRPPSAWVYASAAACARLARANLT